VTGAVIDTLAEPLKKRIRIKAYRAGNGMESFRQRRISPANRRCRCFRINPTQKLAERNRTFFRRGTADAKMVRTALTLPDGTRWTNAGYSVATARVGSDFGYQP
jgi:hypothetical protein